MGKKKAKTKVTTEAVVEAALVEDPAPQFDGLGQACLEVVIAVPSQEAGETGEGRVYLHPDAFLSAQISAGTLVAVALSHRAPKQEPQDLPQLGSPSPPPPSRPGHPINLWSHLQNTGLVATAGGVAGAVAGDTAESASSAEAAIVAGMSKVSLDGTPQQTEPAAGGGPSPMSASQLNSPPQASSPVVREDPTGAATPVAPSFAHQNDLRPMASSVGPFGGSPGEGTIGNHGAGDGGQGAAVVGEYFLLATAWPGKVGKGRAALSAGLAESLGGEVAIGRSLLVFKVPHLKELAGRKEAIPMAAVPSPTPSTSMENLASRLQTAARLQKGAALPTSAEWLSRIMGDASGQAHGLLQKSAAWHLQGRQFLDGNPVALPLLGRNCFFCTDLQADEEWQYAVVTREGGVELLQPGQRSKPRKQQNSSMLDNIEEAAERAAEVAADAVGGGREGPAAKAAFRAAENGLTALQGDGLDKLGGLANQVAALEKLVLLPIQRPEVYRQYGIQPPKGVLLWGPPGTGKTRLAAAMAIKAGVPLFVMNGPDVVSGYYGHSEAGIRGIFAAAKAVAPAIIFMDEVDSIAVAREGGSARSGAGHGGNTASGSSVRIVTTLMLEMAAPDCQGVMVIAATNRLDAIDPALRRPGRFDTELEVGVASPAERLDIMRVRMGGIKHSVTDEQIREVADSAHGFVGADVALLVREASFKAYRRCIREKLTDMSQVWVTYEDFLAARAEVRPSAMREIALEVPKVSWDDVGGLQEVKDRLKESVLWPQVHAAELKEMGVTAPRGILMFGPPGCSKTLLARAVAAEAKLNFLAVKGPELISKYVGESEKAVARVFAKARQNSPSIIFFDEIDGLAGKRVDGDEANGMRNRVLATVLTEMDGLHRRGNVVVLAATNRPDTLDDALIRAGRFDRLLYIPPPDAEARVAILRVHTRKTPLAADVDLERMGRQMEGYTGADITAVVREAGYAALTESMDATEVAERHFVEARQTVPASGLLTPEEEQRYKSFRRGRQGGMTPPGQRGSKAEESPASSTPSL